MKLKLKAIGWKNLFGKSKKMNWKEKSLAEIEDFFQDKDFLWLKGDHMGNTEKFKSIEKENHTDLIFLNFKSGGRINVELVQEYLDVYPASKVNLSVDNPPHVTQPKELGPVAEPKKENTVSAVHLSESPIYSLLKKQKINWVNVNITLKLNLPSKNLYGVLTTSFEEADQEIVNFVTEGIEIEDIKAALGESILSYYDKKKNLVSSNNSLDQIEHG